MPTNNRICTTLNKEKQELIKNILHSSKITKLNKQVLSLEYEVTLRSSFAESHGDTLCVPLLDDSVPTAISSFSALLKIKVFKKGM